MQTRTNLTRSLILATLFGAAIFFFVNRTDAQVSNSVSPASVRALLDQYCVTCHNQRLKTAGLRLDREQVDLAHIGDSAAALEKVISKLRTGAMPPAKLPRPEQSALDNLAGYFERELDRAAAANPNPGRTETLRRLNRAEYQNAIRDLLSADIDASTLLPPDPSNDLGFDNIGGALTLSPVLLERYLLAAREIAQLAIGTSVPVDERVYWLDTNYDQDDRLRELPFGTRGGMVVKHYFPVNGQYTIRAGMVRGGNAGVAGLTRPTEVDFLLDGERIQTIMLGQGAESVGRGGARAGVGGNPAAGGGGQGGGRGPTLSAPDPEIHLQATAGTHEVAVTFRGKAPVVAEAISKRAQRIDYKGGATHGLLYVGNLAIRGPEAVEKSSTPSAQKKFFICTPSATAQEEGCAQQILTKLARSAYRRPPTASEIQFLMPFYVSGRKDATFEAGIQRALERMLVSPAFLFRAEYDPPQSTAKVYRIGDLELASRLSFFLWSSIPDDRLLDLAVAGKLKDPAILEGEVGRMLADEKSVALVDNFAGQWLRLREVSVTRPDASLFPTVDENLRQSMRRQTEMLVEAVLRENRSVYELLTANFAFLNERLARHYGIPNIYGDHLRRVPLEPGDVRGSLLGQGGILMVTSYANRTSPVLRGKYILDNLLGSPPPPPPADVPDLKSTNEAGKVLSMRDRMTQHRQNPACASCHLRMDPLGFALEGFDAVGRTRARGEGSTAIDASGQLPDGTSFEGPTGLRDALMKHKEQFRNTFIEKLLIYALGRDVEPHDQPAVRQIARFAEQRNDTISALILGTVKSVPFQMRAVQNPVAIAGRIDSSGAR